MSDWEARPLSARQTVYAAQDAHVLVRLYARLTLLLPGAGELVAVKKFDYLVRNIKHVMHGSLFS